MRIDAALDVTLKGADLVADTALLTLRGKMGYEKRLFAIARSDVFEFRIESGTPSDTAGALRRFLHTQTLFYNRNKHYYSLRCRWDGGSLEDGVAADRDVRELAARVRRVLAEDSTTDGGKNFRGVESEGRVILTGGPVYRTEVWVEDLDSATKDGVARKLEAELSTAPVVVATWGIRWRLALRADTGDEARTITEDIVVARRRDRGLLLNPNYQGYRFLGAEKMETGT